MRWPKAWASSPIRKVAVAPASNTQGPRILPASGELPDQERRPETVSQYVHVRKTIRSGEATFLGGKQPTPGPASKCFGRDGKKSSGKTDAGEDVDMSRGGWDAP